MELFRWLFDTRFMAHIYCYRQLPALVGLHLISDLSIGVAYVAISLTLIYLVRRARNEIPFSWMFLAFGTFIIACGCTHLMEVWTLWTPVYWLSGVVKALTAVASVTTAFALVPLVPKSLRMLTSAALSEQRRLTIEETNAALEREIDERKRAEDEIRRLNADLELRVQERTAELARANRSLAELAAIVQHSQDAIYSMTLAGVLTSWNPGAERMFGYASQDVVGRPADCLVPADRQPELAEVIERLVAGEGIEPFETTRVHANGGELDVFLSLSPIKDERGAITGASVITRDVTGRKRAENALRETQKLESLGLVAGGVAHDFNNILVGIMGNASLALDATHAADRTRVYLERIVSASRRAAQLTSQLLAYSGKGRFVIEEIDLSATVRDMNALIASSVAKHVDLQFHLASNLPVVEADPGQIQQLAMNMIVNAAEAIPASRQGQVRVTTETRQFTAGQLAAGGRGESMKPGPYVVLQVRDNGVGMTPDLLARIFDPFFTTKFTGRGLGLAAVQGIVRGQHGSIDVESVSGEGSVFTVLLPARR